VSARQHQGSTAQQLDALDRLGRENADEITRLRMRCEQAEAKIERIETLLKVMLAPAASEAEAAPRNPVSTRNRARSRRLQESGLALVGGCAR
jgi:hypothetical protein